MILATRAQNLRLIQPRDYRQEDESTGLLSGNGTVFGNYRRGGWRMIVQRYTATTGGGLRTYTLLGARRVFRFEGNNED